jgi:hypothetical protein
MKTYKLAALLLFTAFISACNEARFDQIPGIYQEMVPQQLQGVYQFKGKDFKSQKFDSLNIEIGMNEIKFNDQNGSEIWTIHQNFQIHQMQNLFILGKNDEDVKTLWNLMVIEPVENGIKVYLVIDEKVRNAPETKLQRFLPFMDVNYNYDQIPGGAIGADGNGQAMPNSGTNQYRFYVVNEEQFLSYFERELKNKNYMLLNRIDKEKNSKKDRKK